MLSRSNPRRDAELLLEFLEGAPRTDALDAAICRSLLATGVVLKQHLEERS